MIQVQATYAKKLGLPNFSSHSFSVSVCAEVASLRKLETESKRLYALLQSSVDEQVKEVGFVPDATHYGMIIDNGKPTNGSAVKPSVTKASTAPVDAWGCSDKQRALIEKVAKREQFTPAELDGMADRLFQLPLQRLDKKQTSSFITELLKLSAPIPFRRRSTHQTPAVENGISA